MNIIEIVSKTANSFPNICYSTLSSPVFDDPANDTLYIFKYTQTDNTGTVIHLTSSGATALSYNSPQKDTSIWFVLTSDFVIRDGDILVQMPLYSYDGYKCFGIFNTNVMALSTYSMKIVNTSNYIGDRNAANIVSHLPRIVYIFSIMIIILIYGVIIIYIDLIFAFIIIIQYK